MGAATPREGANVHCIISRSHVPMSVKIVEISHFET